MATKKKLRRRGDHPAANGGGWIRPDKRLGIHLRDGLACVWCGCGVEEGESLTLDHLKPCSKGGTNEAENLVTACRRCNSSRGNREVIDFAKAAAKYHGHQVGEIVMRIDHLTATDLTTYREAAKAMIARRKEGRE